MKTIEPFFFFKKELASIIFNGQLENAGGKKSHKELL
jgi:hypothetical protein